MPFVQGHLRKESLAVAFRTQCAHCGQSLQIEIDSQLEYRVVEGTKPLVYVPLIDFKKLKDPSIIHAF